MAPEPASLHFRRVFGRLPTGVVVVTGADRDGRYGLVCGSFMSVSLEPPLVAVCPAKTSTSWPSIEATGAFCANVLSEEQELLARRFAVSGGNKFDGVEWTPAPRTGSPRLQDVAAWIDCRIHRRIEAGDHWLILGEVLDLSIHRETGPLVFHGGSYVGLGLGSSPREADEV
jgi:3-hydroxy-9,10-secoandrosta-1,3,5(10)-triene-9,17-dione monooxygenase reductase component